MEVWKSSVLSKWVICRLRVNLPGRVTMQKKKQQQQFCFNAAGVAANISKRELSPRQRE